MKILEHDDGWSIEFDDANLQMIKIDFRLGLIVANSIDDVQIYLGTPFVLSSGAGVEQSIDPEKTQELAPILSLFNAEVLRIVVTKHGDLTIFFRNGFILRTGPDARFEAWEALTRGIRLVCAPEGEVVVYEFSSDQTSQSKLN